jgi:hypothetical protein
MLYALSIVSTIIAIGCLIYLLMEKLKNLFSGWRQIRQAKSKNKKLEKQRRLAEKRRGSLPNIAVSDPRLDHVEDDNILRDVGRFGYFLLFLWETFIILPLAWGAAFGGPGWSLPPYFQLFRVIIGYPLIVYLLWRLVLWMRRRLARAA